MLDGGVFRELSPVCLQDCFEEQGHDVAEWLGGSHALIVGRGLMLSDGGGGDTDGVGFTYGHSRGNEGGWRG